MNATIASSQGLAALRSQAATLPHASTVPPGAVVLSTSGPERADLQATVLLGAIAAFGLGFGAGWWAKGGR